MNNNDFYNDYEDNGRGKSRVSRPRLPPKIQKPVIPTTNQVAAVLDAFDSDTNPTRCSVIVGDSLPAQDGYIWNASFGAIVAQAPNPATAPPSGKVYYNNKTTHIGGTIVYVDTVSRTVVSLTSNFSTIAPVDYSQAFQFIKHDGSYDTGHGFQNPQPIDTSQLGNFAIPNPGVPTNVSQITYPVVTGNGTYDAQISFTTAEGTALNPNPNIEGIRLYAGANGRVPDPKIDGSVGTVFNEGQGVYTVIYPALGAGNTYDLYYSLLSVKGHESGISVKLGTTAPNPAGSSAFAPIAIGAPAPTVLPSAYNYFAASNAATYDVEFTVTLDVFGTSANNSLAEVEVVIAPLTRGLTATSNGWAPSGAPNAKTANGAYTLTAGGLGAGTSYSVGLRYVGHTGNRSNVYVLTGATNANGIILGGGNLATMPTLVASSGPSITAMNKLVTALRSGGGISSQDISFTVGDYSGAVPNWLKSVNVILRKNIDQTQIGNPNVLTPTSGIYTPTLAIPTGITVDAGIYYVDQSGASSAVVYPSGLTYIPGGTIGSATLSAMPAALKTSGPVGATYTGLTHIASGGISVTVTLNDFGNPIPGWFKNANVAIANINNPTAFYSYTSAGKASQPISFTSTSMTFFVTVPGFPGDSYNIGVYYEDMAGQSSTISTFVSNFADPNGVFADANGVIDYARHSFPIRGLVLRDGTAGKTQDWLPDGVNYARTLGGQLSYGIVSTGGTGKEMLQNPSFESNVVGTPLNVTINTVVPMTDGWRVFGVDPKLTTAIINNTGTHTGFTSNYLQIGMFGPPPIPYGANTNNATYIVSVPQPCVAGQNLQASGWINGIGSIPSGFAFQGAAQLWFYNGTTVILQINVGLIQATGGGWTHYSIPYTVPAFVNVAGTNTAITGVGFGCVFYVQNNNSSAVATPASYAACQFDDLSLVSISNLDTEVSDGSTYGRLRNTALNGGYVDTRQNGVLGRSQSRNLIVNGNNSNGTGAIAPSLFGWTQSYSGGSVANAGAFNGYSSLQVSGPAPSGVFQTIPVLPNQTYTFIALAFCNDAGSIPELWIGNTAFSVNFNATLVPTVGLENIASSIYGIGSSPVTNARDVTGSSWRVLYGSFTIPNDATIVAANVLLRNVGNASGSYWQAVQVYQGNRIQDYVDHEPQPGAIHLDRHVIDGSTYGRPLISRLSNGRPWIDFSEAIHAGKHLGNIGDFGSRFAAIEANADSTTNHQSNDSRNLGGTSATQHNADLLGTQVNLIPDSDMVYGATYWNIYQQQGSQILHKVLYVSTSQNVFQFDVNATPVTGINFGLTKSNISVTAGRVYSFSAYFDPYSIIGNYSVILMNGNTNSEITRLTVNGQTAATRYFLPNLTMPTGCTFIYLLFQGNVTNATAVCFVGQLQLEPGPFCTSYKPNLMNHGQNGFTSSTPFNSQGSILNVSGTPGITTSSTSSSVSISLPGTTYTYTDNVSKLAVLAIPFSFPGLAASSTYYFNVYVNIATSAYGCSAPSAAGTKWGADAVLSDCYRDGRVGIYANLQVSTIAAGTTAPPPGYTPPPGGGAGPTCPAEYQMVETQELGLIRADQVEVGHHLQGPNGISWVRVNDAVRMPTVLWRYCISNGTETETFDVNETHASKTLNGEWQMVRDMEPGDKLMGNKRNLEVVYAENIGDGYYIGFSVEGYEFSMGGDCVHNINTL
jgi:hypothetical protein